MRFTRLLTISLASCAIAACGSSDNADADGDGTVSAEEMQNAAAQIEPLQPGQYKMSMELVDLVDPTVQPEEIEQAKQMFAAMGSMAPARCMTEEELENGMVGVAEQLQDGDCEVSSMNSSRSGMNAEMVCKSPQGEANVTIDSTSTGTSSEMTMTATEETAEGPKKVVMKIGMERQGDCPD